MKVSSIQSTNFESKTPKKRYIPENMRFSIESLLLRMNNETTRVQQGDYFKSILTTKLKMDSSVVFEDERRLNNVVPYKDQMQGFSSLKMGKSHIEIDNKTGEIIDYKKPWYQLWCVFIKKAEEKISELRSNYYSQDVVKKETQILNELTPDGMKKMKRFVLETEKERLKNVVAQLEKELKE